MKISILFLSFLFLCLTSFAQKENQKFSREQKAEIKRAKAEAIREMVKNKSFIFKAKTVNPVNAQPKTLITDFGIEVRNDTIFSYLPYYGNTYSRDYTSQKDSPMGFIQPIDNMKTKRTRTGYLVEVKLTNVRDVIEIDFHINLDGLTSVTASSINRQSIGYSGEILIPVLNVDPKIMEGTNKK